MKNLILCILLILFAGLSYLIDSSSPNYNQQIKEFYSNGILKKEIKNINETANYDIEVEYKPGSKVIKVKENIVWINNTKFTTDEIFFHLYANGYDNNKTEFLKGEYISEEHFTRFEINNITVEGIRKNLEYVYSNNNPDDKTVAKLVLDEKILPGDTVKIRFDYKLKIPLSYRRMGYAEGRDFVFIAQWFPKVGVFEEGEWICSPYYKTTEFYSDFGDYSVKITTPENYKVGATGVLAAKDKAGSKNIYQFRQSAVHDFAFFVTNEILDYQKICKRKDGSEIAIKLFVQPENEKYVERYFSAVENSLEFMEENISVYPYQTITIVDVPRTAKVAGREHPTIFTVKAGLFSPVETHEPEEITIHEFVHQYFYGIVANNEVYEAWIDEGITSYLTTKILEEYYGKELLNFKFVKHVPVYGINFLNFYGIPLIYILGSYEYPQGNESFYYYTELKNIGEIADSSFKHQSFTSYFNNTYSKPELMFLSLEKIMGREKLLNVFKEFYTQYKFKHPKGNDLLRLIKSKSGQNLDCFFENVFYSSNTFDYKISSIRRINDNEYSVIAERLGGGIFESEIYFYTETDTLIQKWDGKDKWKEFIFTTNNNVLGAEIDPQRKNYFDINFANNSYTVKPHYLASLSLAVRWFFWVQNALMVLGSIG